MTENKCINPKKFTLGFATGTMWIMYFVSIVIWYYLKMPLYIYIPFFSITGILALFVTMMIWRKLK